MAARALLATGEIDEAERAYRESLKRAPGEVEVAMEFANIVWMHHGDAAAAQAVLDAAYRGGGAPGPLLLAKAKLMEAAAASPWCIQTMLANSIATLTSPGARFRDSR